MSKYHSLHELKPGQSATIAAVNVPEPAGQRLLELGMTAGTKIACLQSAPGGDPTAYRFQGVTVALRSREAEYIRVEELTNGAG